MTERIPDERESADPHGGPVDPGRRVEALDAVRGLAILGILLVNIQFFYGPEVFRGDSGGVMSALIGIFGTQKFITLFAMMFGLGLALQTMRADRRGQPSGSMLVRRLVVLAGIGALHAVLIWSGDILFYYALLGFVVLAFRRRPPRTCVVWSLSLLAAGALILLSGAGLLAVTEQAAGDEVDQVTAAEMAGLHELADRAEAAYTTGTYAEQVQVRLAELSIMVTGYIFMTPTLLGMALLGVALARSGFVETIAERGPALRRMTRWGLAVGLPLNVVGGVLESGDPLGMTASGLAGLGVLMIGGPVLGLAYASIMTRVAIARPTASAVRRLASVGRMAVSNYLLQSLLATAVFYGLGLYGTLSLEVAMLLVVAIWTINLLWSLPWLKRFRYGPVEWLWRAGTYGRLPAMREPSRAR